MGNSCGIQEMSEKRLSATQSVQYEVLRLLLPGITMDEENMLKFCSFMSPFLHRRATDPLIDGTALEALSALEPSFSIAYQAAWLSRESEFMDTLYDKSTLYEPKPVNFGDFSQDENEVMYIKSWLKWHDQILSRHTKEGPVTFEEVFNFIQKLRSPTKPKLLFKNWAICTDENGRYIVVDKAFTTSFGFTKALLVDILDKRKISKSYWISNPTAEHTEYLRNTYGGRKLPTSYCMLDVRALVELQETGHKLNAEVKEFLQLLG